MEGVTIPDKVAMKGLIWHKSRHRRALPRGTSSGVMTGLIVWSAFLLKERERRMWGEKKYHKSGRTRMEVQYVCYVMLGYVLSYFLHMNAICCLFFSCEGKSRIWE